MTQAERVALGDNLVACIDDYQNSLADDRRPEVTGMKEVLASMRVVSDNWRKGRGRGWIYSHCDSAADIQRRFDQANQQYANLVQLNKRYESDRFARGGAGREWGDVVGAVIVRGDG